MEAVSPLLSGLLFQSLFSVWTDKQTTTSGTIGCSARITLLQATVYTTDVSLGWFELVFFSCLFTDL